MKLFYIFSSNAIKYFWCKTRDTIVYFIEKQWIKLLSIIGSCQTLSYSQIIKLTSQTFIYSFLEPKTIQDPWLVPEQTERYQGRQDYPGDGQHSRQQASWGLGASEEDPLSSWSSSLLGTPYSWSAHQDYRTQGKNCRSFQEEIILSSNDIFNKLFSGESCFIEHYSTFRVWPWPL